VPAEPGVPVQPGVPVKPGVPAPGRAAWPFPADDPYPTYHRARAEDPVQWSDALGGWLVLSHRQAEEVLRGPQWSSDARANPSFMARLGGGGPEAGLLAKMILFTDPPEHDGLRGAVSRFFTPRRVADMQARIRRILDVAFEAAGDDLDLMADIAYPVTLAIICELLDVGVETAELLRTETPLMTAWLDPLAPPEAQAQAAASAFSVMLTLIPVLADRRSDPGDDLLSALLTALEPDEAIAMALVILAAGHETTANLIGNGTLALAAHPHQRARLQADPALMAGAVEELLRWDSPVQVTGRVARTPTRLGGHRVSAGEQAIVVLGSANRDPDVWPEPDQVVVDRPGPGHLAFGRGAHFCIGAALARAEAAEVFARLAGGGWEPVGYERVRSGPLRRLNWLALRRPSDWSALRRPSGADP
jgi:hypothetical protein